MSRKISDDTLMDRKEAAAYIGLKNPGTLAVWHSKRRYNLPLIKVGFSVRYRKSDLDNFLERRLVK